MLSMYRMNFEVLVMITFDRCFVLFFLVSLDISIYLVQYGICWLYTLDFPDNLFMYLFSNDY